ncbi:hypothetical protein [Dactylosporangium sp. CA-233914]|uniref:hypothetical protein n=1 Tax=Dactylosporangium sp. CA-233914 TaxID=3239934 RepID=UPI003D9464B5
MTTTTQSLQTSEMIELQALVLEECAVKRGDATNADAGNVDSDFNIHPSYSEGDLRFLVQSSHDFHNADGELIVTIDVSFSAWYRVRGQADLSESFLQGYVNNSLMRQVIPFVREFLANMTNRLGIETFYLPLFVRTGAIEAGDSIENGPTDKPE